MWRTLPPLTPTPSHSAPKSQKMSSYARQNQSPEEAVLHRKYRGTICLHTHPGASGKKSASAPPLPTQRERVTQFKSSLSHVLNRCVGWDRMPTFLRDATLIFRVKTNFNMEVLTDLLPPSEAGSDLLFAPFLSRDGTRPVRTLNH